eukprot:scaffold321540_cov30-Tisochrysis_lutea.AAC.1
MRALGYDSRVGRSRRHARRILSARTTASPSPRPPPPLPDQLPPTPPPCATRTSFTWYSRPAVEHESDF